MVLHVLGNASPPRVDQSRLVPKLLAQRNTGRLASAMLVYWWPDPALLWCGHEQIFPVMSSLSRTVPWCRKLLHRSGRRGADPERPSGPVKHVTGQTFTGQRVLLDGSQFDGCTFTACQIVYRGGKTRITNCTIQGCRFTLEDAAIDTLRFLSELYKCGAAEIVDGWFSDVRTGPGN